MRVLRRGRSVVSRYDGHCEFDIGWFERCGPRSESLAMEKHMGGSRQIASNVRVAYLTLALEKQRTAGGVCIIMLLLACWTCMERFS